MNIYLACALNCSDQARGIARILEMGGHIIVSSWHDTAKESFDPSDDVVRGRILRTNLADLETAQVVIVFAHIGNPRATYCEAGYALAIGKRLVWVHNDSGDSRNIFDAHSDVTRLRAFDLKSNLPLEVRLHHQLLAMNTPGTVCAA